MKRLLIWSFLLLFCIACTTKGMVKAPRSIEGKWVNPKTGQVFVFQKNGYAQMIVKEKSTFSLKYKYDSKTEPAQLDLLEFDEKSPLKGLYVFGIVQFPHRDTLYFNSKKGREGQAEKYRPKEFSAKRAVYIRQK